jgi:hypothetical protein
MKPRIAHLALNNNPPLTYCILNISDLYLIEPYGLSIFFRILWLVNVEQQYYNTIYYIMIFYSLFHWFRIYHLTFH